MRCLFVVSIAALLLSLATAAGVGQEQSAPTASASAQPAVAPEQTPRTNAQTPGTAPAQSGAPETGGFDISTLTPDQQAAIKLAIIKLSQNPVGNITALPFQNNFNYGVGPYARYQYNLNVQPVIPIMLGKQMNLIARTIFPVVVQPSFAPPIACASGGCSSTFGIGDIQEQLFFAPKTKPGELIWGIGPILAFPTGSPNTLGSGKWGAGLDAVALVMPGKWVIGALVTQTWSYAGWVFPQDITPRITRKWRRIPTNRRVAVAQVTILRRTDYRRAAPSRSRHADRRDRP